MTRGKWRLTSFLFVTCYDFRVEDKRSLDVRAKLLRGFLLGRVKVEPLKGVITADDSSRTLSPEALDILLHLASEPGKSLSHQKLIKSVWGKNSGSEKLLERAVSELYLALFETPDSPQYIESLPGNAYRLLARVEVMNFSEADNPDSAQSLPIDLPLREMQAEGPIETLSLWQELKQRRVMRVGIGYLLMSWLLLQIADVVFPVLDMPFWSMKLLTLLLAAGFVVTLVVSWLVQVTPAGVVLDTRVGRSSGSDLLHLVELIVILVLLVGASTLVYKQIWRVSEPVLESAEVSAPETSLEPIPVPAYEGSIAVLPFINMGEDPKDKYFGDGLAEELLHKLARVKALKVAARTSSFSFVGQGIDIPTIARQLQVMTVLEGSIRREQNTVRVTAQLVDSDGFHLWSDVYDYEFGEILNVQSEIALSVAKRVASSITPDASAWLMQSQTSDLGAFDAYLKGLEYLHLPRRTESLKLASEWFDAALELDPRFARAWAASCETELSWFRLNRDIGHFERAERQCNRALTLDSESYEVYTALGNLYRTSSQFEEARQFFERAVETNPYTEEASYGLARSLEGLGDLRGAERLLHYSVELEPGYWGPYMGLGNFLFRQGRYEEAATYYTRITELTPDNPDGYTNLGSSYFGADNWEEAEAAWQVSLQLAPNPMAYRNMGTVYYYQGRYEEAAAMHREAVELAPEDHWLWGKLAAAYRNMGDEEEKTRAAYERASELAHKRLEVDAADGLTMAYLAAYLVSLGELEEAERYINAAIELVPDNPEVWYFSGLVNTRLNHHDLAIEDISRAIEMGYSTRLVAADPQFSELSELESFQSLIQ